MKAIFDTRAGSEYDDDISSRYHFPDRYLPAARAALGDWIIYREPRRGGGREGYVAVARVGAIEPDTRPDFRNHHYARVTDFLWLDHVVPLRREDTFYETRLNEVPIGRIGPSLRGRSIRSISDAEFGAIVRAGMAETLDRNSAIRLGLDQGQIDPETHAILEAPVEEQERRIAEMLTNRKIRDASFRNRVLAAYDQTCAVTGLRIVNGGGRAEAQAAHIWAVKDGGPDTTRNGIALSGTIHWLFDRHLISLTDDCCLLVSHNRVPAELRGLIVGHMEPLRRLPSDPLDRPHPDYIKRHRDIFAAQ